MTDRAPELLYLTTDPMEIPLVMPTWARSVPELAEKIDEGLKRRAEYPYTDAEREMMRDPLAARLAIQKATGGNL